MPKPGRILGRFSSWWSGAWRCGIARKHASRLSTLFTSKFVGIAAIILAGRKQSGRKNGRNSKDELKFHV
jgi:hypothetical protein